MLGLPEQVGRADFAVDRVVRDDQRFGRAGEQVDADAAVELALRLRHIGVARPDHHVDGANRAGAERHHGDRLHAAEHIDLVRAAEMHRGDDRGMRPALKGGAQAMMRFTPATRAVTIDMCAEATIG